MRKAGNQRQASFRVLLAILWLTLLVLSIKVWTGWATRSLSLLAESLYTLLDCCSIVLSLIAVASPGQMRGREWWSHTRWITAAILSLVMVIGFVSGNLLLLSYHRLQRFASGEVLLAPMQVNLLLVQLLTVIAAVNICLMLFARYEARMLESQPLRMTANHMLKDVWFTILMLSGLTGVAQGYLWLDPLMAIALILISIPNGWQVLNRQLPSLVKPTTIAPEALAQLVLEVEGVNYCYRIRSQGIVGRQIFVEINLVLQPDWLKVAYSITDQIKAMIRERYGPAEVVIHIGEISVSDDERNNQTISLKPSPNNPDCN